MTNDDVAELLLELGEELRTLGQRFHDEAYNSGMWPITVMYGASATTPRETSRRTHPTPRLEMSDAE